MIRQIATDARRLSSRRAAGIVLPGLRGTYEQLLRPGPGRPRG